MIIGITGGIGSGKSYICNRLREMGYPVYNCDDQAKALMVENKEIITSLRNLISYDVYTEQTDDGGKNIYRLNKDKVASFLFANSENASRINTIVHPIVKKDFIHWAEKQTNELVFMECAILYEAGFDDVVDKTVLIYADEDKRIQRAMERDNTTKEQVLNRIRQQIRGTDARLRPNYILNHNEYDTTEDEIDKMLVWAKGFTQ